MLYTCGVNSKKYIMKISHTFLFAALCCATYQSFAATTPEGASYTYSGSDPLIRNAAADKSTLSYTNDANATVVQIKNSNVDATAYDTFTVTSNSLPIQIMNSTVKGNNVIFDGKAVRLQSSSTLDATNVTLAGGTGVWSGAQVIATNQVTIKDEANTSSALIRANVILLEGTGSIKNTNFTADTIRINGSSIQIGGDFEISGTTYTGNTVSAREIKVESGTLSLEEVALGDTSVTMDGGLINILSDVEVGELTLNGGTLNFDGDYVISLGGEAINLSDDVAITISVDSVNSGHYVLFEDVALNSVGLDNLSITVVDATGAQKEVVASYSNGSVTVTIPEPTTATLSLLALAGLAARRRRK